MFEIALHIRRGELKAAQPSQVIDASELDTTEAQLMAACEFLADAAVADFRIVCGGDRPWPVDVQTDLSVFLEQCAGLLHALDKAAPSFRLEMYEQGIETVLVFNRQNGMLRVRCEPLLPGGERRFGTQDETLGVEVLTCAVATVVANFIECCKRLCPQLLALPEMTNWQKTIERLVEAVERQQNSPPR